jgi:hypothetical protein
MVCAASRSGAEGAGQGGVCGQMPVPVGFILRVFGWLACRSSCCGKTFSVNPGGGPAEIANPGKAHHQGRSHLLLHGEPAGLFRGLPGVGVLAGWTAAGPGRNIRTRGGDSRRARTLPCCRSRKAPSWPLPG